MKKAFSAALALIMLLSLIAACGSGGDGAAAPTTSSGDPADTAEPEETGPPTDDYGREIIESSLPSDLDLGGSTMNVFYRDDYDSNLTAFELYAPEENGEIINDAVYRRNRAVEERLNVKLNITTPNATDYNAYSAVLKNSVQAGDNAFDIAPIHGYYGPSLMSGGFFRNLLDTAYIDLSKPWWNADFTEQITLFDSLYGATGDIALTAAKRVFGMFFNKKLLEEYFPGTDLYGEVRQGKWTIDRFGDLIKDAYRDLNGDSARDSSDFYAWFVPTASIPIDTLEEALEIPITAKNSDGVPEIVYNGQKTAEAYSKVYNMIFGNDGVYAGEYTYASILEARDAFVRGSEIFLIDIFEATETMREMQDDYGVLPIFKWDESQEIYKTAVQDVYSIFVMSTVTPDPDAASAVMEAMAECSYLYVTPEYFEIALKQKYARGDSDAEMYDILLAGRGFNFGVVYSEALGDLIHQWRILLDGRKDNWQSTIDKKMSGTEKKLTKLLEKLESVGQ
ncbi:MAG: extracellular solute-binding protein [Clostridia bacterium]|nr:extracellular solute-binding protein [Clostridia bacterium]